MFRYPPSDSRSVVYIGKGNGKPPTARKQTSYNRRPSPETEKAAGGTPRPPKRPEKPKCRSGAASCRHPHAATAPCQPRPAAPEASSGDTPPSRSPKSITRLLSGRLRARARVRGQKIAACRGLPRRLAWRWCGHGHRGGCRTPIPHDIWRAHAPVISTEARFPVSARVCRGA